MKIVYITGCAGFIGSYFTDKALKKGWRVYGIDKLTYASNIKKLEEFKENKNFSFIQEDIKDIKYLKNCDYVINFAAESHVDNSIVNSKPFIDSNVEGVRNLLELIRLKHSNSVNKPIFVQISTDEVYGDIQEGSFKEEDLLNPSNPYAASKAAAEMLVTSWARTYGLEYLILRPTNNYGKRQYPEKLIPLAVYNLMRGNKIKLHNAGTPVRSWIHVEDTTDAIMHILENEKTNEKYNISAGFEQKNNDTVEKIIKSFCGQEIDYTIFVDYSYKRIGQDVRYSLNYDKLKSLGWQSKKNFDDEIKEIVEYYRSEYEW
jgi:dTDP-glucose 4,6-dehydratase